MVFIGILILKLKFAVFELKLKALHTALIIQSISLLQ